MVRRSRGSISTPRLKSLAKVTDPLVLHPNTILTSGNEQQGPMTTRTKNGCTQLTGENVRTLNEATTKIESINAILLPVAEEWKREGNVIKQK